MLIWTGIGENIEKMHTGHVIGKYYDVQIYTEEEVAKYTLIDWMNSEGHRANILSDIYDDIVVGVAYDGEKYYYITQTFR